MHRLTNLADVLRGAGLNVIEVQGWQDRGRSGDGGYYQDGRPTHVMMHHTASTASAESDVKYMTYNASAAPIANLYIARDGAVWVMAGGPTNTNGKGEASWDNSVANDDMNRHAIGIEIGNSGVGEPYPAAQQDAALRAAAACTEAYRIPVDKVRAHKEYSPGRKIDPAGPSQWSIDNIWDMDAFRASVRSIQGEEGDDVFTPMTFRNSDTRALGSKLTGGKPYRFAVQTDKIPPNTRTVSINVTATEPDGPGFISVWTSGPNPGISLVNFDKANQTNSNSVVVGLDDGHFMIESSIPSHAIVDVLGYFS